MVQRNKIKSELKNKFYSIQEHDLNLLHLIEGINPDIIWIEVFGETFIKSKEMDYIYKKDRTWKNLESTHTSSDLSHLKTYVPDKFIFVSKHSELMYKDIDTESDLIEYPVDYKSKQTGRNRLLLGFDDKYVNIINIGIFTPGKNQGYAFDIARNLIDYKIKFHFVGNQAGNFKDYWKPILDNKPNNCIIHGEKDNVDEFIQASDLLLFTSKEELNPLVLKEAMEYKLPTLAFNLDSYHGSYNDSETISFLTGDLEKDCELVLNAVGLNDVRNVKAVHLLIDTESKREALSIKSMERLSKKINYVKQ